MVVTFAVDEIFALLLFIAVAGLTEIIFCKRKSVALGGQCAGLPKSIFHFKRLVMLRGVFH